MAPHPRGGGWYVFLGVCLYPILLSCSFPLFIRIVLGACKSSFIQTSIHACFVPDIVLSAVRNTKGKHKPSFSFSFFSSFSSLTHLLVTWRHRSLSVQGFKASHASGTVLSASHVHDLLASSEKMQEELVVRWDEVQLNRCSSNSSKILQPVSGQMHCFWQKT